MAEIFQHAINGEVLMHNGSEKSFKGLKKWEFNKIVDRSKFASVWKCSQQNPPASIRKLRLDLYEFNSKRLSHLSLFFNVLNKAFYFFQKDITYLTFVYSPQAYLVTIPGFKVLLNTLYTLIYSSIYLSIVSVLMLALFSIIWDIFYSLAFFFAMNYNTLVNLLS